MDYQEKSRPYLFQPTNLKDPHEFQAIYLTCHRAQLFDSTRRMRRLKLFNLSWDSCKRHDQQTLQHTGSIELGNWPELQFDVGTARL